MKRIVFIILAVVLALGITVPVMAQPEHDVDTKVEVTSGGGTNSTPIIKAKWETAGTGCAKDDDTSKPGTQVDPNVPQGDKTVYFWAVVTDTSLQDLTGVWVDIWYPDGITLKDQIQLSQHYDASQWVQAQNCVTAADTAGLVVYDPDPNIDFADVLVELQKGTAWLFRGQYTFTHGQYGGFYEACYYALDDSSVSDELCNCFEYVRTVYVEADFEAIDFGAAGLSEHTIVPGNDILSWLDGEPTVKNGGNVDTKISVHYYDMFLTDLDPATTQAYDPPIPMEEVEFDARLGLANPIEGILPCVETEIGILPICNTVQIDFSIHPMKVANDVRCPGGLCFGTYEGDVKVIGADNGTPDEGTPCPPLVP